MQRVNAPSLACSHSTLSSPPTVLLHLFSTAFDSSFYVCTQSEGLHALHAVLFPPLLLLTRPPLPQQLPLPTPLTQTPCSTHANPLEMALTHQPGQHISAYEAGDGVGAAEAVGADEASQDQDQAAEDEMEVGAEGNEGLCGSASHPIDLT